MENVVSKSMTLCVTVPALNGFGHYAACIVSACGQETASPKVTRKSNLVAKFGSFREDSGRQRIDCETSAQRLRRTVEDSGRFGRKCPAKIRRPLLYPVELRAQTDEHGDYLNDAERHCEAERHAYRLSRVCPEANVRTLRAQRLRDPPRSTLRLRPPHSQLKIWEC